MNQPSDRAGRLLMQAARPLRRLGVHGEQQEMIASSPQNGPPRQLAHLLGDPATRSPCGRPGRHADHVPRPRPPGAPGPGCDATVTIAGARNAYGSGSGVPGRHHQSRRRHQGREVPRARAPVPLPSACPGRAAGWARAAASSAVSRVKEEAGKVVATLGPGETRPGGLRK